MTKRSPIRSSPILAACLMLGCVALLGFVVGLAMFAASALRDPVDTSSRTDAIVALTGGNSRIDAAITLLNEGLAPRLFISGVNRGSGNQEVQNANRQSAALFACCIVLGYQAANTIGNADETARWMQYENYHSLRLVTADYHMPRALLDFRLAMPGITIVPHPIHPQVSLARHVLLLVEEYTKYLATLPRFVWHRFCQ